MIRVAVPNRVPSMPDKKVSTHFQGFLVAATIVLLPLQDAFSFNGVSPIFLSLVFIGLYVIAARFSALASVLFNRIFVAAYAFLVAAFGIESLHLAASYYDLTRMGEVVLGAAVVAALCCDRRTLQAAMYGWVLAGLWLTGYLVVATYGPLRASVASTFSQASLVRANVVENGILHANVNTLAFITAVGSSTALALALGENRPKLRAGLFVAFAACLLGTFLPLSRAGVVIAGITAAFVVLSRSQGRLKALLSALVIVLIVLTVVPNVALTRIQFPSQIQELQYEARFQLYATSIEHFGDYVWSGVGSGNYWASWAYNNDFMAGGGVVGAHNAFLQVTIYWGLPGLALFLAVVWLTYRALPKMNRSEALAVCVRTLALALLLRLLVTHDLYSKEFALGLGMIAGSHTWIWQREAGRPSPINGGASQSGRV
jgi:O-antigen ligase